MKFMIDLNYCPGQYLEVQINETVKYRRFIFDLLLGQKIEIEKWSCYRGFNQTHHVTIHQKLSPTVTVYTSSDMLVSQVIV